MKSIAGIAFGIALLILPVGNPSASASLVTFRYSAVSLGASAILSPVFSAGDTVEGTYTFESSTPGTAASLGVEFQGAIKAIDLTIFDASHQPIYSASDVLSDGPILSLIQVGALDPVNGQAIYFYYAFFSDSNHFQTGEPIVGLRPSLIYFFLAGPAPGFLPSDTDLPLTPPDPSQAIPTYETSTIGFSNDDNSAGGTISIRVTSLSVIPEPASYLLLSVGLTALGWRSRSRRRLVRSKAHPPKN